MKLYAFYSTETGDTADFCVIAESEEQARQLVSEYIADKWPKGGYEVDGWPDNYGVKVRDVGQVASNWGPD